MFKEKIADLISKSLKLEKKEVLAMLEVPPSREMGDYAFPCFTLAGKLKRNPKVIAEELAGKIRKALASEISEIKVVNAYVNFFINETLLAGKVIKEILKDKDKFGRNNLGKSKKIMIEFSSPNTNKPLHLGHLRNESIGSALANILSFSGYKVTKASLLSDRGIHIAKTMLAYNLRKNKEVKGKPDHFVGDLYVEFSKLAEKNPELEHEALELLRKWEKKDKATLEVWKKLNDLAVLGIRETNRKFGTEFDVIFRESEFYNKASGIIQEGLKKGVFEKEEDGAIIAKLAPELPDKVVLRGDGTSIYITSDLALTPYKFSEFKIDESIWVTGSEQLTYFKQLFAIFKKLERDFTKNCRHLIHGLVLLPEGKMKSREGKVVDADDFIQHMEELARKEITTRLKLSEKEKIEIAEAVALSAIKYYFLKVETGKDVLFLPEKAISFEGDTGPYLQYSYARCSSILKKSGIKKPSEKGDFSEMHDNENILVKKLSEFPESIEQSAKQMNPAMVAGYAYHLSKAFNDFYESCPVLNASGTIRERRIKLAIASRQVLESCLRLLGIKILEKM